MINKKWLIRILLFAGTLISLYFVPWPLLNAWIKPLPDTIQEQVNKSTDYGFDGIIVYVDKKGQEQEFYVSGYKDRERKTDADPHSLFKIASIDKLYNALALTKLVRRSEVALDSSLSYYLPEMKGRIEHSEKITLKMLVQHRSGIPNFTDTYNYWSDPNRTEDEKLALILDKPANFEPGTEYQYCNTNYLLLGRIMNKVLGYDKFEFIQHEILDPLNLSHTYGSINDVNPDDVMSGYYVGFQRDLKSDDHGSMLSTAEDLGIFIRALNEGTLFSDKKEQEIYSSIYEYGHTGLIPGYQSIARYHPDIDAVVIQFTNTVDFEGYNWSLSELMYSRILKIIRSKAKK